MHLKGWGPDQLVILEEMVFSVQSLEQNIVVVCVDPCSLAMMEQWGEKLEHCLVVSQGLYSVPE